MLDTISTIEQNTVQRLTTRIPICIKRGNWKLTKYVQILTMQMCIESTFSNQRMKLASTIKGADNQRKVKD